MGGGKKQTIYNGICNILSAFNGTSKLLLVCDESFQYLCIKDEIIDSLEIPYVIFSDFTSNPLYEDVCKGVKLFRSEKCDTILAVGGGSTIDVAKCIKLFCQMDDKSLYLNQEYRDTGVKLIAIPSTAGTGSESTRYAVIYYQGKKQSITHDSIIPDVAILDHKVLKSLPVYQKKCTMMDALCQGIESWWSINSTERSKALSQKAVEEIMHWWHEYIFENTDESAKHIMYAANLAGQAICITQTTAPHAFSYKLTSMYKLPHGHAVAICLPQIWEYMDSNNDKCIDSRGNAYLTGVFNNIAKAMGCQSPIQAISKFREMMKEIEMDYPVSNNIYTDIVSLSSSVNPIRLKNNPVELNLNSIESIYRNVIKSSN